MRKETEGETLWIEGLWFRVRKDSGRGTWSDQRGTDSVTYLWKKTLKDNSMLSQGEVIIVCILTCIISYIVSIMIK